MLTSACVIKIDGVTIVAKDDGYVRYERVTFRNVLILFWELISRFYGSSLPTPHNLSLTIDRSLVSSVLPLPWKLSGLMFFVRVTTLHFMLTSC
jgi:hypothetical protein